ncbi:MAG: efflux RND transporter periplasmic adaptor subunit [Anaerolineae bacterium]|nr:efflux RND transporter periplasmic adaptor subunit [Anaerolineae bacterium]
MKHWWIVLLIIAVLAAVGVAGYMGSRSAQEEMTPVVQAPPVVPVTRGDVAQTVTAPGMLVGTRSVMLSPDVSGRLAEIAVRPGDAVKAGAVLARLATGELEHAVAEADLSLRQAQLALEKLQQPVDEAELRAAEHAVTQAASALSLAQAKRDQTLAGDLFLNGLSDARIAYDDKREWYESRQRLYNEDQLDFWFVDQAQREFENAQKHLQTLEAQAALEQRSADSEVTKAAQTYREAQDRLAALEKGRDPLELEAAQLKVEAAQMGLDEARSALAVAVITAPFDGIVLEVKVAVGEPINAGSPLIALRDPYAVEIEASVIEEDFPLVVVGQAVELFFDAQPDVMPSGTVARIVPQRMEGDRPLYPVIITVDETLPDKLVPGMTVDASIVLDSRADALRLPRAIVRARSDGSSVVKVWDGQAITERAVKVGLRGDVYAEILEGLQEGEQVVAE